MSSEPVRRTIPYSQVAQIREGREILRASAVALETVAHGLGEDFSGAVALLSECRGRVVVAGVGKAGRIGRKLVATFSSTGTRSQFLHPVEAVHGDIGCVEDRDVALVLSNSGESDEVSEMLPLLAQRGIPIVAITADRNSTLGRAAEIVVAIGTHCEAGGEGLAPTTSTTILLAVGDALALVTSRVRGFSREDFARCHPAGSLGRRLAGVADVMRSADELRIAREEVSVREVFAAVARPGRRTGAVLVVDSRGALVGIFTDSDLARLLEQRRDDRLDRSISTVMTVDPLRLASDDSLERAVEVLSQHKVSELPVVDDQGRPVGLIDITDVIGLLPGEEIGLAAG
ncbi:MAG: KpsF/GutQ family sugar-phosphate isomerase [Planctomycetaceae bacterium]